MTFINCRQCGFTISKVEEGRNSQAQSVGFCCDGCQEVHEKLRELAVKAALRSR